MVANPGVKYGEVQEKSSGGKSKLAFLSTMPAEQSGDKHPEYFQVLKENYLKISRGVPTDSLKSYL